MLLAERFLDILPISGQNHPLSSSQYTAMLQILPDQLRQDCTTIFIRPLQVAAQAGNINMYMARILLESGSRVNQYPIRGGRTALQAAAEAGHMKMVRYLLSQGARINDPPESFQGRTALQGAAEFGHIRIVGYLVSRGATINDQPARVRGRTALQAAAGRGHLECVYLLLNKGAAIDAPGGMGDGRTAFQAAAERGHPQVIQLLLQRTENDRFDEDLNVALQLAIRNRHASVVDLLINKVHKIDKLKSLVEAIHSGHVSMLQYLFDVFGHECVRGTTWGRLLMKEAAEEHDRQLKHAPDCTDRDTSANMSEMMLLLTHVGARR